MTTSQRSLGTTIAVLTALACTPAFAQTALEGFELERLDLNGGRGALLASDGQVLEPTGLDVSVLGHYQYLPLPLYDIDQLVRVVQHRATGVLSVSYGVLSWLELNAKVPLVLWQQGEDPESLGLIPVAAQGLGTPTLRVRFGLLSQRQRTPQGYSKDPLDLAVDLGAGFPVGSEPALGRDAGPRFLVRVAAGMNMGFLRPSIDVGALFRPSIPLETENSLFIQGATSEVHLGATVSTVGTGVQGELSLRTLLDPNVAKIGVEVMAAAHLPLFKTPSSELQVSLLGGGGLVTAIGTPRFRALAGITYRYEPPPDVVPIDKEGRVVSLDLNRHVPVAETSESSEVKPTKVWIDLVPNPNAEQEDSKARLRTYQLSEGEQELLRGQIDFIPGSVAVPGRSAILDQAVLLLYARPGSFVIIEGHADPSESNTTTDLVLSAQRAQEVRRYLVSQNVEGGRIRTRPLGSDVPANAHDANGGDRHLNRRATVLVLIRNAPNAPNTSSASSASAP